MPPLRSIGFFVSLGGRSPVLCTASMNDVLRQAETRFFMEADPCYAFTSSCGSKSGNAAVRQQPGYVTASRDVREQQEGNNNDAEICYTNYNNPRKDDNENNDAISWRDEENSTDNCYLKCGRF